MKLKMFVVALILCCYPNFLYASYDEGPKNLLVFKDVKNIPIIDKDGKSINIGMTASQTIKDKNQLIFCNYATLYLMDLTTGITKILEKPKNVEVWVPTGVKWCPDNKRLYLANYLGKDILVLKFDEQDQLSLVKRYVDEELIGPENIDVIEKGKLFVVSDFDSSKVILFNESGKIWSHKIGNAHGISFSKDKKFIYASGLSPAKLYKFDLQGNLINKIGKPDWWKDGYLWPTSVAVSDKNIIVSDAHTGKITFVDESLNFQKSIGGNGLGITLFNMPYGIIVNDNFLFVTDTFKGRILKIDPEKNKIISIYKSDNFFDSQSNALNDKFNKDPQWVSRSQEPLGLTYKERTNLAQKVRIDFNKFGLNVLWNPSYNGLNHNQLITLSLDRSIGFFSGSMYYWTLAKNFEYNGYPCTIIGSPEVQEWLFLYKGIVYPIRIGMDFWIGDNSLISSRGQVLSFETLAEIGTSKIESYIELLKNGEKPLDAMANLLEIPDLLLEIPDLASKLPSIFVSKKGKKFGKNLMNAKTTEEQQKAAKLFLQTVENDSLLYFCEISIASMVVYGL